MKYEFKLNGETAAKKNNKIVLRNHAVIPSKRYRDWHKSAMLQLLTQNKPDTPISYPVKLEVVFVHNNIKKRDCDNQLTSIMDLLKDAHILADDNWLIVNKVSIVNILNKTDYPFCVICIEDCENHSLTIKAEHKKWNKKKTSKQ